MNKILKGAVAGAAGIALLLGGAGTFALWNANETVAAGTISSGQLSLTKVSDGAWSNTTTGTPKAMTTADVAAFKAVPGNSLQWKGQLKIKATGNDLTATLTSPTLANVSADFTVALSASSVNSNVARVGATNNFTITPNATDATVDVVIDIKFATKSGVFDNSDQGKTVDLSLLKFKLEQLAIPSNVNP